MSSLSRELKVPVTCKMRVFDDIKQSIDFALMLQDAGCKVFHWLLLLFEWTSIDDCYSRKEKRTKESQFSRWLEFHCRNHVWILGWLFWLGNRRHLRVPVIANGGIKTKEDAEECLRITKADAVMVGGFKQTKRNVSSSLYSWSFAQSCNFCWGDAESCWCCERIFSFLQAIWNTSQHGQGKRY